MAASVSELLREIGERDEPLAGLHSLKAAVNTVPLNALREVATGLRFGVLFNLLETDDREQIDVCVAILERLLQALEPVYLAQTYKLELQKGLQHSDDRVKVLALTQIQKAGVTQRDRQHLWRDGICDVSDRDHSSDLKRHPFLLSRDAACPTKLLQLFGLSSVANEIGRIAESIDAVVLVLGSLELLKEMIHSIGGERISVANEAIKSLSRIAQNKAGLDALFTTSILQDLKDVMGINDVVRYRVYELVLGIAVMSPASLEYCVNGSFITRLLGELAGDDVLIRATAIEMLTTLTQSQHGRLYLAQQGIIDRISNMIIGANSDPFSSFYLPNLVKFFGNLAMVDSPQQICECYPAFIEKVFEMIKGNEQTMIGVGLDTIGMLGSCLEGKQVLNKTGTAFQDVLSRLGSISCNASSDLRVRCLETIARLHSLPTDQQTEDLLGMTESWFHALHNHPMETFRSLSMQPFPEIHIGALKVFTAIAGQPWGQRLMISTPGFVEYIVDRTTEADKSSKDAKFELVKALVNTKTIAEIFGNQHYLQLRAYLQEGPYFVKAVATVAVEGGE